MRRVKKRKGIEAQRVKTPSRAIDALIGDEKQKKEQKERNREEAPNLATLNHLVTSYDPHGSYGGTWYRMNRKPHDTLH